MIRYVYIRGILWVLLLLEIIISFSSSLSRSSIMLVLLGIIPGSVAKLLSKNINEREKRM
jgi:hypothetical protein